MVAPLLSFAVSMCVCVQKLKPLILERERDGNRVCCLEILNSACVHECLLSVYMWCIVSMFEFGVR